LILLSRKYLLREHIQYLARLNQPGDQGLREYPVKYPRFSLSFPVFPEPGDDKSLPLFYLLEERFYSRGSRYQGELHQALPGEMFWCFSSFL